MISLSGKSAIITGGSRGIGQATAIMFAEVGCNVVIGYEKNETAAKITIEKCQSFGVKAVAIKANMGSRSDVFDLVAEATTTLGSVDILVNNAGVWEHNPIDEMTEERLRRTVDINLMGCFHSCQAVVPQMKERKSGNIINISSTAGQRGEAFHSPYSATKSALIGLTKSLAVELADHNIRVNCVAPGWVETDMSIDSLNEDHDNKIISKIPMGRVGMPQELAGPILFMASELSTFITGEILNVNGGAVLCG
ncbi:MAG: 3-oxoacyl-ACP reductase FabG [bacterium]|nr:3-oxoacyl-ACP reductase FabG [bacterium]